MSTISVDMLKDTAGGNQMSLSNINAGRAKAWSNLNGIGTIALRDSFNLSSLIDNGTGNYSYNLSTPVATGNNVLNCSSGDVGTSYFVSGVIGNMTSSRYQTVVTTPGDTATDISCIMATLQGDAA